MLASHLKFAILPAIFGPNSLVIRFPAEYNQAYEVCDREENLRRIAEILERECGRPIQVNCELVTGSLPTSSQDSNGAMGTPRPTQTGDRKKLLMGLPLFRKAGEALGAQIWHVDDDFNPVAAPRPAAAPEPDSDPDEI
jgi:DNA polymerase-3 subunit gamma/tau